MITRIVKQILGVLATGYILFYYSELVFWARAKPTDSLPNWISTWLAYSLLAFVFLAIVARFRVHTIWALFLAGAVFGWMTEGIVVQTTYEDLPLSLSFTGLAWHALISINSFRLRPKIASHLERVSKCSTTRPRFTFITNPFSRRNNTCLSF